MFDVYDGRTGERITEIVGDAVVGDILGGAHSFSADGAYMMLNVQTNEGEQWSVFDTDTGDAIHAGGGDDLDPTVDFRHHHLRQPPEQLRHRAARRRDTGGRRTATGRPHVDPQRHRRRPRLRPDRHPGDQRNGARLDRESGEQIGREIAIGRQAAGTGIAIARDGDLVGIFLDTEFAIWNYDVETWPALACEIAGRNMTQREWNDFGPQDADYRVTCPQFPPGG